MTEANTAVEDLGAEYFQDPYSSHARLRAERPVAAVNIPGLPPALPTAPGGPARPPAWLITGYADARAALNDPRLRKTPPGWQPDPARAAIDMHLLNSDPPDHERLRRLVNKAFTPRRSERLRPRIASITAELLDDISTHDEVDLVASFAFPLPLTVICELLGVPVADRDDLHAWFATMVSNTVSPEKWQADATALIGYFIALLLNPAEFARLRADRGLLSGAVDELLRFSNPVNTATHRFAAEPVEIGGVRIGPGDLVLVALSGANRDPSRFADPDRLDLGRDSSAQLGFGHGIHYCLGTPLARLQAEIAFGELMARFPAMRLAVPADDLRWRTTTLIHGLEALPVRLGPVAEDLGPRKLSSPLQSHEPAGRP